MLDARVQLGNKIGMLGRPRACLHLLSFVAQPPFARARDVDFLFFRTVNQVGCNDTLVGLRTAFRTR